MLDPSRLTRTFLPTLVFAATLACGDASRAPDRTAPDITYDTIAGVVHVTSHGPGLWAEQGNAWQLDESERVIIGDVAGADEYVFGQISGLVVDGVGQIYVADTQANEIRVFSSEGAFLRRLGREGEGPGEFRNISGLALAPDGLAALDGSVGRVTVFSEAGEVERTFRLDRPYMIFNSYSPMAFDDEGRFFDRASLSRTPGVDTVGVLTYSVEGDVLDTARIAVVERDLVMLERDGRPYMSIPRPFAPHLSFAFGPDGLVYFTRGDEHRVDVFSPVGEAIRTIRRPVERSVVTEVERDSALAFVAEAFADQGAALPAGLELPERKAAIGRLVVDDLGYLWVLRQPDAGDPAFEWSVHDPMGRLLGTVSTPPLVVTQIGPDFVAGTTRDELGVPRAVVYPLRR